MSRARLSGIALALVLALIASGSVGQTYRVGVLWAGSQKDGVSQPFMNQLKLLGYEEGKNLVIESRYAEWNPERFPQMAHEIVRRKPDIIFAPTNGGALAARDATQTIPVIFAIVPDPVSQGLVASLGRPGGNVTGTTNVQTGLTPKRMQLLQELVPRLTRVGIIYDATDKVAMDQAKEARKAAADLKLQLYAYEANSLAGFQKTFDTLTKERAQAVLITGSLASYSATKAIAELAIKHRLPTMSADRKYVEDGALISYGVDIPALYAKAATYVHRVLKGARPADLPVEEADKFEMVINMRTARALGVNVPSSIALRADQIIQ